MPDADDFDVEYFRNLLQGNTPKDAPAPPGGPSPPVAQKSGRWSAKAAVSAKKGKPAAGRKNSKNR